MKIIEEKENHKIFPMRIVCKREKMYGIALTESMEHCGSVLEIEEKDITKFIGEHPKIDFREVLFPHLPTLRRPVPRVLRCPSGRPCERGEVYRPPV